MGHKHFTRRAWLSTAALLTAARAWPLNAAPKPAPLRTGEPLPDPDFTKLREERPHVVGVRPHRKGGVRLELQAEPLASPSGPKQLIHNYGHGGAGITLSWGCASVATGLVDQAMQKLGKAAPRVAVLGAGVIGLTTATELRRRWPDLALTVYAKDLDVRTTTSFIAGGQFEPSGIYHEYEGGPARAEVLAGYLRLSKVRILELQNSGQRLAYGVAERKNYTLDHENRALDAFTPRDVIAAPRTGALPFQKLNVVGREYSTWLMNPTLLLPKLVEDLAAAHVGFATREFASVADVAALPENIVVNCTGYGAKKLFGDEQLVGQRGHLVVLQKTDDRQFYFFSGGCENPAIAYVFCRQDDIVVGGTVLSGQDTADITPADDAVFARLVTNGQQLFGGHPKACRT